jgi:hypothetical protein
VACSLGHRLFWSTFWFRQVSKQSYFVEPKRHRREPAQWRKLTIPGGYKLAMKRNIGHISCMALSDTLELNISRQCVAQWELALADSCIVMANQWHDAKKSLLLSSRIDGSMSWEITTARADATNSSTLQSHKVHSCELTTLVNMNLSAVSDADLDCRPLSSGSLRDHTPHFRATGTVDRIDIAAVTLCPPVPAASWGPPAAPSKPHQQRKLLDPKVCRALSIVGSEIPLKQLKQRRRCTPMFDIPRFAGGGWRRRAATK